MDSFPLPGQDMQVSCTPVVFTPTTSTDRDHDVTALVTAHVLAAG